MNWIFIIFLCSFTFIAAYIDFKNTSDSATSLLFTGILALAYFVAMGIGVIVSKIL